MEIGTSVFIGITCICTTNISLKGFVNLFSKTKAGDKIEIPDRVIKKEYKYDRFYLLKCRMKEL